MIVAQEAQQVTVQLRLDLADSPAPAEALWELLGEESRQAAEALLTVLIAQSVAGKEEPSGNE
jgi:hypothetical protein